MDEQEKEKKTKLGRPVSKLSGIHPTCMSFDKEIFEKFKVLSKLKNKSITSFLEEMMLEQLSKEKALK